MRRDLRHGLFHRRDARRRRHPRRRQADSRFKALPQASLHRRHRRRCSAHQGHPGRLCRTGGQDHQFRGVPIGTRRAVAVVRRARHSRESFGARPTGPTVRSTCTARNPRSTACRWCLWTGRRASPRRLRRRKVEVEAEAEALPPAPTRPLLLRRRARLGTTTKKTTTLLSHAPVVPPGGSGYTKPEVVLRQLRTSPGLPWSSLTARADIDAVYATGLFEGKRERFLIFSFPFPFLSRSSKKKDFSQKGSFSSSPPVSLLLSSNIQTSTSSPAPPRGRPRRTRAST